MNTSQLPAQDKTVAALEQTLATWTAQTNTPAMITATLAMERQPQQAFYHGRPCRPPTASIERVQAQAVHGGITKHVQRVT